MRGMPIYFGGALILGAFVWFFCAYLCYITAPKRGRTPLNWGILGIVFGPIALFALYLMPHGHSTESKPSASGEQHQAAHGHQSQSQADLYEVPKHKKD
jgi:hypothetical protein